MAAKQAPSVQLWGKIYSLNVYEGEYQVEIVSDIAYRTLVKPLLENLI